MRQTVTWHRGVYIGEATTAFRGTLERVEEGGSGWCGSNCAAYLPHGEVTWTWTWESAGPNCRNRQSGSVSTGDVVTPADQMLIMEADGPDHLRYWGRGQVMAGQQDCNNPEGGGDVGSFLEIPPYEGNPYADEVPTLRPRC